MYFLRNKTFIASMILFLITIPATAQIPKPPKESGITNAILTQDIYGVYYDEKLPILTLTFEQEESGIKLPYDGKGALDPNNFVIYQIISHNASGKPIQARIVSDIVKEVQLNEGDKDKQYIKAVDLILNKVPEKDTEFVILIKNYQKVNGKTIPDDQKKFTTVAKYSLGKTTISDLLIDYLIVDSNLPIDKNSKDLALLLVEKNDVGQIVKKEAVPLQKVEYPIALESELTRLKSVQSEKDRRNIIENLDLNLLTAIHIYPEKRFTRGREYTFEVEGIRSLLYPKGEAGDSKEPLKGILLSPPKGKDDSRYYAKLFWQLNDDKKAILSLDLKLAPLQSQLTRGWWFEPSVNLDVGTNNSPSKNNMIFSTELNRFSSLRKESILSAYQIALAASFEADRDLDKKNGLFSLGIRPYIRNFILTREMKKFKNSLIQSLSNLPSFGYGIEPRVFLDIGRSIQSNNGKVTNSARNQTVEVPNYTILRLRQELRTFIEWRRINLEVKNTLRVLLKHEFGAVLEKQTDSVSLRTMDNLRNIVSVNLNYVLDENQNSSIGMEFQKGEDTPKYESIQILKTTFILKF